MKKWFIGLAIVLLVSIVALYTFIPSKIEVSSFKYIQAYHNGLLRFVNDTAKVHAFFASHTTPDSTGFTYKSVHYKFLRNFSDLDQFEISVDNISTIANLVAVDIHKETSALQWFMDVQTGSMPWTRIQAYRTAVQIKESITSLLDEIKTYADKTENLYGIHVTEIKLQKDTTLITTDFKTNGFPSVATIYEVVHSLQHYAESNQAKVVNAPMLHLNTNDNIHFDGMVGLSIDKSVPGTDKIHVKHMPFNGKMFITEVQGGFNTIQNGFQNLEIFRQDSKRALMAMPYQLLVTDRSAQPDTSKWVTDIYLPINN